MILPLAAGSFAVASLLAWGLNWLALIPWRRSAGQHCTERARLLYPARKSAGVNMLTINPVTSLPGGANNSLLLLIPVLFLALVRRRVSHRMEERADKIAIECKHINPEVYARALERLYQTNQMPAVTPSRANKTHPDLYDRMLAAGVTPDFPKPKPARSLNWINCLVLAGLFVLPVFIGVIKTLWVTWQTRPSQ